MNPKEKISKAQAKIIDELAACEDLLAALYTEFGRNLPEMSEFWTNMAREESNHGAMLRTMHKLLEQGHIFFGIGHFNEALLRELNDYVRDEIANVQNRVLNSRYALAVALKIETSLIESRFYELTTSDAPQFRIIAERLCADTRRHQQALQAMEIKH